MTIGPHRAEDKSLHLAERLVALLTGTDGRTTAARRKPMAEAEPEENSAGVPAPPNESWARAQLREQIKRAGTELAPAAEPPARHMRKTDRSPYADREPEP